jgi:hypothetical protein
MGGARVSILTAIGIAAAAATAAQEERIPDPFRLLEPKAFVARRASSNSPDPQSNDDSLRPIPGETVVLADLQGPGVVSHIWLTVAASEYGWPRLLRLRVYYDGSATPSVDAPLGDFFAVGHGFERPVRSLMVRASSEGRSRNSYWPMPFRRSCRITVTNEGRRRVANLYYRVDWQKLGALPERTPYRLERRLLVPGGRRHRPASRSLRARAAAPGQRDPDRGRGHPLKRSRRWRARPLSSRVSSGPRACARRLRSTAMRSRSTWARTTRSGGRGSRRGATR